MEKSAREKESCLVDVAEDTSNFNNYTLLVIELAEKNNPSKDDLVTAVYVAFEMSEIQRKYASYPRLNKVFVDKFDYLRARIRR